MFEGEATVNQNVFVEEHTNRPLVNHINAVVRRRVFRTIFNFFNVCVVEIAKVHTVAFRYAIRRVVDNVVFRQLIHNTVCVEYGIPCNRKRITRIKRSAVKRKEQTQFAVFLNGPYAFQATKATRTCVVYGNSVRIHFRLICKYVCMQGCIYLCAAVRFAVDFHFVTCRNTRQNKGVNVRCYKVDFTALRVGHFLRKVDFFAVGFIKPKVKLAFRSVYGSVAPQNLFRRRRTVYNIVHVIGRNERLNQRSSNIVKLLATPVVGFVVNGVYVCILCDVGYRTGLRVGIRHNRFRTISRCRANYATEREFVRVAVSRDTINVSNRFQIAVCVGIPEFRRVNLHHLGRFHRNILTRMQTLGDNEGIRLVAFRHFIGAVGVASIRSIKKSFTVNGITVAYFYVETDTLAGRLRQRTIHFSLEDTHGCAVRLELRRRKRRSVGRYRYGRGGKEYSKQRACYKRSACQ